MGAMKLRELLLDHNTIRALFGFSNERYLFESVHHGFKVCLLVATKGGSSGSLRDRVSINPREAIDPEHLAEFLRDRREHLEISADLIRKTSPDSLSVMELKSSVDVSIVTKMLKEPMFGDEVDGCGN